MTDKFREKHSFKVLEAYFDKNSVAQSQIDSYNEFIAFGLQRIIDQDSTISITGYTVKFGQIIVSAPQVTEENRSLKLLYPSEARMKDLSYDGAVYCDVTTEAIASDGSVEVKTFPRQNLGRMPVMLKSAKCNLYPLSSDEKIEKGECPNDPGGYFIIKGNERVIVSQMRSVYNQIFVLEQKPGEKYRYIAEMRSMSEETGHSILIQAMIGADNRTVNFSLPYIKEHIPVGIVFKALGYTEDQDILNFIDAPAKYRNYIIRDSSVCKTKAEALAYIGQYAMHIITEDKKESYAWQVVETELFPHLGISGSIKEQACMLGVMVRRLLATQDGRRKPDDRDNYSNKRVEMVGTLIYDIFRNLFKKYTQFIKAQLEKRKQRPDVIPIMARLRSLTKGLYQCFSTGNWVAQKNASYVRTGVSQILDRMTYISMLSHLRRILIPVGKEGKNSAIRQIHQTCWGYIDPCETPEGAKVGTVLNTALLSAVTRGIPAINVKRTLEDVKSIVPVDETEIGKIYENSAVFLNGGILGFTSSPVTTVDEIREFRAKKVLDAEISVTYDIVDNEVRIFCDEGRFFRPLYTLTNNKLNIKPTEKYDWDTLLKEGLIKYLDPSEIENSVIAMTLGMLKKQVNDYCEIHPCVMLGILSGKIPFPDHSQSPRNCYSSSMMKQALGIPTLSYNLRTDTILHVMHYPQRPIVSTKISDLIGLNKMPAGMIAIVAIASWAYNQEDSVVLNASSAERGMFCLTSYHTIDCCEKKRDTYSHEKICLPPKSSEKIEVGTIGYFRRKNANYSLLDEEGIIRSKTDTGEAITVKKGDVLVGKVVVTGNKSGDETRTDASVVVQPGDEGVIDRVHVMITPNGYKLVKIVIRVTRIPTLGDKLASTEGQKGTIGMVYNQIDMPWTSSGVVPDIIINSCCIPSRMTINQLIECVLGKEALISGEFRDATPFTENSTNVADKLVKKLSENIQEYGFEPHGNETMYSGTTGEMIKAKIFMGPTYYQKLKHMVDDKLHARARGAVTNLTRQPLEGRARDGGKILMPQWYLIVLLVHVTVGNIAKYRGNLVYVGFRKMN